MLAVGAGNLALAGDSDLSVCWPYARSSMALLLSHVSRYKKMQSLMGRDFFSNFNFYTGADPTHGTVGASGLPPRNTSVIGALTRMKILRWSSLTKPQPGTRNSSPALVLLGPVRVHALCIFVLCVGRAPNYALMLSLRRTERQPCMFFSKQASLFSATRPASAGACPVARQPKPEEGLLGFRSVRGLVRSFPFGEPVATRRLMYRKDPAPPHVGVITQASRDKWVWVEESVPQSTGSQCSRAQLPRFRDSAEYLVPKTSHGETKVRPCVFCLQFMLRDLVHLFGPGLE